MKRKILLVNEDVDFVEALAYLLRRQGYDTTLAYDGELGLQKAESHEVALVVTDLALPDRSGLELIKRLRARGHSRLKPIFVVTAHTDQTLAAIAEGANQVFCRPLDFDGLLHSIHQVTKSLGWESPNTSLCEGAMP